jgi:hypothetical protein
MALDWWSTKNYHKKFDFSWFLLPMNMNEVNMKYWFSDLRNKFFIDFLDELGLFIEENRFLRIKNFRRSAVWRNFMAVQMKIRTIFERCFQVRDFSFWITEGIGLTGVSFHFGHQKHIPSGSCHRNFWLLFHFHVKHLPIFMFLGLIWC